jgi:hemolysin-activating ACP:hemolysin acyltransferase
MMNEYIYAVQGQHVQIPPHLRGHLSLSLQHLSTQRTQAVGDTSWFKMDSIDDRELPVVQLFRWILIVLHVLFFTQVQPFAFSSGALIK